MLGRRPRAVQRSEAPQPLTAPRPFCLRFLPFSHIPMCNTLHMSTNLALDDRLIEAARRAGKHKTKKEAVNAALDEYVQRRKQMRILDALHRHFRSRLRLQGGTATEFTSCERPITAMMVLVDTPVWSLALRRRPEHLSGSQPGLANALADLIREGRAQMVGPIRQELLSGIRGELNWRRSATIYEPFASHRSKQRIMRTLPA